MRVETRNLWAEMQRHPRTEKDKMHAGCKAGFGLAGGPRTQNSILLVHSSSKNLSSRFVGGLIVSHMSEAGLE